MSSAKIHLVHRNPATKRSQTPPEEPPPAAPGRFRRADQRAASEDTDLQFSTSPLSRPAEILRRMPGRAISPALLGLIEAMSSPVLLTEKETAGDLREIAAARTRLAMAA